MTTTLHYVAVELTKTYFLPVSIEGDDLDDAAVVAYVRSRDYMSIAEHLRFENQADQAMEIRAVEDWERKNYPEQLDMTDPIGVMGP